MISGEWLVDSGDIYMHIIAGPSNDVLPVRNLWNLEFGELGRWR